MGQRLHISPTVANASWAALIVGLAGEGVLLWMLDQLPLWAQLLLYVPVGLALLWALGLVVRDRIRRRRRLREPKSQ